MTCPNCNFLFETPIDTCSKCGYPFKGTDKEKSSFIAQQILKVGEIDNAKESLQTAKRTLFIIGILNVLLAFFSGASALVIGYGVVIGLVFIIFGFIVEKSPFVFLLVPLVLLILVYILSAIFDPMTIVRGITWKIVYVTLLVYAIVRVQRAEKIRKESEYLGQQ